MLKAPYCWQRHRVQWTRGYCRAVLRWSSDCIEPRYKSSAFTFSLPFALVSSHDETGYQIAYLRNYGRPISLLHPQSHVVHIMFLFWAN